MQKVSSLHACLQSKQTYCELMIDKSSRSKTDEKKKDSSKHDDDYGTARGTAHRDPQRDKSTERNRPTSPQEHRKEQKNETGGKNKKAGDDISFTFISKK